MKGKDLYGLIGNPTAAYYAYAGTEDVYVSVDQSNFFFNATVCCVQISEVSGSLILIFHEWDVLSSQLEKIGEKIYEDNCYIFHKIKKEDIKRLGKETKPFGFFGHE